MDKRVQWGLGGAVVLVLGVLLGFLLNDVADDYDFIQLESRSRGPAR